MKKMIFVVSMLCGLSFNASAELTVGIAEAKNVLLSEIQARTKRESEIARLTELVKKETTPGKETYKGRKNLEKQVEYVSKIKEQLKELRADHNRAFYLTVKTDTNQALAAIGKLAKGGFRPEYCLKTLCRYKIDPIKAPAFHHLVNEALDKDAGDIAKGREIIEDRQGTLFYEFQNEQFKTKALCEKHRKAFAATEVGTSACIVYDPKDGTHFSKVVLKKDGSFVDKIGSEEARQLTTREGNCKSVPVQKNPKTGEYPEKNVQCNARYELKKDNSFTDPEPKEAAAGRQ